MKEVPNNGLIRFHGLFNEERLLVTTSEGVRDVLVTNPYHFHKQRAQKLHLRPVSGDGLVTVEGDEHKFHRKHMSPAFSTKYIRDCQPIFWQKTKQIVEFYTHKIDSQRRGNGENRETSGHAEREGKHISTPQQYIEEPPRTGVVDVHEPISRAALDVIGIATCTFDFDSLRKDEAENELVRNYRKAFGVSRSNHIRCLLARGAPAWVTDHFHFNATRT